MNICREIIYNKKTTINKYKEYRNSYQLKQIKTMSLQWKDYSP